jgi:hypothetical protein
MARAPINYILDVQSPVERAMRGYQFGLGEVQAEREEDRAQQRFGMEQERFGMEQERFRTQQSAAAQAAAAQRAQAERQQAFYNDFSRVVRGELPRSELLATYPDFAETMSQTFEMIPDQVAQSRVASGQRIQSALRNNRPDIADNLLANEAEAARNSGNQAYADQLEEMRRQIEQSPRLVFEEIGIGLDAFGAEGLEWGGAPEATTAMQTLDQQLRAAGIVPRAEGGDGRYEQAAASAAGVSGGPTFRQATPEEAAVYGATAGQIDTATGRFYPIELPTGMTFETGPDGTVRLVQGPGVGAGVGSRTSDYQYMTDADGRPVARPIAGTPAAAEVQGQRGRLEAAVGVGQNMLQTIESVVGRPAGDGQTGLPPAEALEGILGLIRGNLPPRTQAQADLLARIDQISGRAFLEAFETLKGGGQITEIEGQKATQAIARLQRTQSPEAFQEALFEFADIVRRGIERSRNELRVLPEVAPASNQQERPAAPAATGGRIRYDSQGNRIE